MRASRFMAVTPQARQPDAIVAELMQPISSHHRALGAGLPREAWDALRDGMLAVARRATRRARPRRP